LKSEIFRIKDYRFTYPNSVASIAWKGEIAINQNDRILLSGNSGAGKSTLLYALKGFFPETIFGKTEGVILFRNEPIELLSPKKKLEIGLLFQNPETQIIHKKVRNELAFGLENLELPAKEIENSLQSIAEKFHIEDLLERNIATLSGGEKQKIALLSILLMNPQVLLLDEPTAFLDEVSALDFITAFYKIFEDKTILIVEHNLHYLQNQITTNLHINEHGKISYRKLEDVKWRAEFAKIAVKNQQKPLWQMKQLAFTYEKNKHLLSIHNFTVYENEILGIMGKNGSGKTTFIKILAGLIRNFEGELLFRTKKQNKITSKILFKEISLLFQNPENHFLFSNVKKEVQDNYKILSLFGLSHLAEKNPFNLSEGEKRRLSLAIQFSLKRNIFLMDEPTFGQDPENRANLLNMIQTIRENGGTFVIVSHDSTWLKAACDRIVMIKDGDFHAI
jgi:energy-coupling factor transport system ATP-binding protein